MNGTWGQDHICCYHGCALGVPRCCPLLQLQPRALRMDQLGMFPLTSATTARDLQDIIIPAKNHGIDTVTVTKRRAGASSEHFAQIPFRPVL